MRTFYSVRHLLNKLPELAVPSQWRLEHSLDGIPISRLADFQFLGHFRESTPYHRSQVTILCLAAAAEGHQ
jgi:hypothetical protein